MKHCGGFGVAVAYQKRHYNNIGGLSCTSLAYRLLQQCVNELQHDNNAALCVANELINGFVWGIFFLQVLKEKQC